MCLLRLLVAIYSHAVRASIHFSGRRVEFGAQSRQAELIYREDLKEFRNNGWSLFGLAHSLRAQGKPTAARKAEQGFKRAWKNADVTLKASVF